MDVRPPRKSGPLGHRGGSASESPGALQGAELARSQRARTSCVLASSHPTAPIGELARGWRISLILFTNVPVSSVSFVPVSFGPVSWCASPATFGRHSCSLTWERRKFGALNRSARKGRWTRTPESIEFHYRCLANILGANNDPHGGFGVSGSSLPGRKLIRSRGT